MSEPLSKEIFKVLEKIDQIRSEIERIANQIIDEEEKHFGKICLKTLISLLDRCGELVHISSNFNKTFNLLLTHILKEKIKYATSSNKGELYAISLENNLDNDLINDNSTKLITSTDDLSEEKYEKTNNNHHNETKNMSIISNSQKKKSNNINRINGKIKGETEKALLITFDSGQEIWIPKSTIHCQYTPQKDLIQDFLIDNWILNRNKIVVQH